MRKNDIIYASEAYFNHYGEECMPLSFSKMKIYIAFNVKI